MSTVAVPRRRVRNRRLLWIALAAGAGFALAAAFTFAWPGSDGGRHEFRLGAVDDFSMQSVTTVEEGEFHLVRLAADEFVALSWREPGQGCTVPWRPNFEFDGTRGWFRDPCSGSTFDRAGLRFFGPAPRNLDRHVVAIVDGKVVVDTSRYVCGFAPPGEECTPAPTP